MPCNENLFDIVVEEFREQSFALSGPAAAVVVNLATALDLVLVSVGVSALATDALSQTNPQLQSELQASHEEFLRTRTTQRTRSLVDCIANFGNAGTGSRKPEDVIEIFNNEQARATRNFNSLVQLPNTRTLVDSWGDAFASINNCIEEAIDDSMTVSTAPCPRISVTRQKEICDRFFGEL